MDWIEWDGMVSRLLHIEKGMLHLSQLALLLYILLLTSLYLVISALPSILDRTSTRNITFLCQAILPHPYHSQLDLALHAHSHLYISRSLQ